MDKNIKKGVIGTWLIRNYKLQFGDYLEIKKLRDTYAREVDMEYNPSNLVFVEWLASKFYNHLEIDWYTKNALWVYWMRGDDEVVLSNKEVLDLKDKNNDDEHEITEIFRIETNLFDYKTPLCTRFNELNYLLKVDTELFTHDVERTKTYEDYENKLNKEVGEPWSKNRVPYEIYDHICEPFYFKNGKTKWLTCNSNEDGFCNGGELLGMVRVGYMTYFQDYEWYDDLTDSSLKDEALKQKAIYEKSWGNATQRMVEVGNDSDIQEKEEQHKEGQCDLFNDPALKPPVCKIRRFEMIKYSFRQEEEYVDLKEYEYDDLTRTNKDACYAYQEIFRNMDEGWLVTRMQ
ncbi:hypothetical protein Tco_1348963 [Tanacetum coccineum]